MTETQKMSEIHSSKMPPSFLNIFPLTHQVIHFLDCSVLAKSLNLISINCW